MNMHMHMHMHMHMLHMHMHMLHMHMHMHVCQSRLLPLWLSDSVRRGCHKLSCEKENSKRGRTKDTRGGMRGGKHTLTRETRGGHIGVWDSGGPKGEKRVDSITGQITRSPSTFANVLRGSNEIRLTTQPGVKPADPSVSLSSPESRGEPQTRPECGSRGISHPRNRRTGRRRIPPCSLHAPTNI